MITETTVASLNVTGAIIGATTGGIHETYIVVKKKDRKALISNYLLSVLASSSIGWLAFGMLEEYGIYGFTLYFLTVIISLNSYIFIQAFTNWKLILVLLGIIFPERLSKKNIEKLTNLLKNKND